MSLDEVSINLIILWFYLNHLLHFTFRQKFNKAAEDIKTLTARPTDDELKEIYALFKQATVGDINVGQCTYTSFLLIANGICN